MEKTYEVRLSDTFSIEAGSKDEAIRILFSNLKNWIDPASIEVLEY